MSEMTEADWVKRVQDLIETQPMLPGRGKVLVVRTVRSERFTENVLKPDTSKEKSMVGVVVALGRNRENMLGTEVDYFVKLGDRVVIYQFAGKEIRDNGLDMTVVNEEDIVIVLRSGGPAVLGAK